MRGSIFGVAGGGGVPFRYYLLILCLQFADNLLHVQHWQQGVRAAFLVLLVVVYYLWCGWWCWWWCTIPYTLPNKLHRRHHHLPGEILFKIAQHVAALTIS